MRLRSVDRGGLVAAVGFGAACTVVSWLRWVNFWAGGFDTGVFDQGAYLMSRGRAPTISLLGRDLFSDHLSPVMVLFAVPYRIVPTVFWLYLAQGICIGLTVLPNHRPGEGSRRRSASRHSSRRAERAAGRGRDVRLPPRHAWRSVPRVGVARRSPGRRAAHDDRVDRRARMPGRPRLGTRVDRHRGPGADPPSADRNRDRGGRRGCGDPRTPRQSRHLGAVLRPPRIRADRLRSASMAIGHSGLRARSTGHVFHLAAAGRSARGVPPEMDVRDRGGRLPRPVRDGRAPSFRGSTTARRSSLS